MNDVNIRQLKQVLDYIDQHLDETLTLRRLAKAGHCSPFHFHRLFRAYTKESLNSYVVRKRIEQIAAILIRNKTRKITELAYRYGFSSNAALTKTFKKTYQLSPSAFRKQRTGRYDKILYSKNGQVAVAVEKYICRIDYLKNRMHMNANITVKELPALKLVYITQIGVQGLEDSFYRIIEWALQKGLLNDRAVEAIRIYHDSFKITDPDKVRMEVGVLVGERTATDSAVFYREIQPGLCIVGSFELHLSEFEQAWSSLFIWMNENGYQPGEVKPFEIIRNNYIEHPEQKCIIDLCIPVQKSR